MWMPKPFWKILASFFESCVVHLEVQKTRLTPFTRIYYQIYLFTTKATASPPPRHRDARPVFLSCLIIFVKDIPYTLNMKKVELTVRKVIHNQPVLNRDALRNPEVLDYYVDIDELQKD